jgi:6-phosphogluconolactonase/Glucosamine-6-phosphate isomerase/deaminase
MKTVLVNNSIEASSVCIDLINKELNKASRRLNIALTGGRFGKYFADELIKSNIILEKIRFFQTDERLVRFSDQDCIQKMLLHNLAKFTNLEYCFFDLNMSATASALNMNKNIDRLKLDKLDIAMMSLGEDGHLAGNFPKSKKISDKITYINDSPKTPS